jgi:hypothetical protein
MNHFASLYDNYDWESTQSSAGVSELFSRFSLRLKDRGIGGKSVNRSFMVTAGKTSWAGRKRTSARQPCGYVDIKDYLLLKGIE